MIGTFHIRCCPHTQTSDIRYQYVQICLDIVFSFTTINGIKEKHLLFNKKRNKGNDVNGR